MIHYIPPQFRSNIPKKVYCYQDRNFLVAYQVLRTTDKFALARSIPFKKKSMKIGAIRCKIDWDYVKDYKEEGKCEEFILGLWESSIVLLCAMNEKVIMLTEVENGIDFYI